MIAVAVALDRWLAVAELRPADRQRHTPRAPASAHVEPAASAAPRPRPATARHQRALPLPAPADPPRGAGAGGALGDRRRRARDPRALFPDTFPDFLTGAELARASAALRLNAGLGAGNAHRPALAAPLAVAWTLFGTTLPLERFLTALCVVAALLPFHALLRRVVGVVPALGATLLLSVSRPAILAGRGGVADPAILLLAPLVAWLLLRARERGDGRTWALCGVGAAALLLSGAAGWGTLLALAVWLGVTPRDDAATPLARRRTAAGLTFASGFALLIALLATLAGGGELRATLPPGLGDEAGRGPLGSVAGRVGALLDVLATLGPGSLLDRDAPGWLDPLSVLLGFVGFILALRGARRMVLWWCLATIPLAIVGLFGTDPATTIPPLALLPGYAFVALALDGLLRWERLGTPLGQLAALIAVAILTVANVANYALWSTAPDTLDAQGTTIATRDFYRWRDYQVGNLAAGRGIVGPDEFATLAPATIAEQTAAARRIAEGGGPQDSAAPRDDLGQEVATIGIGENGGHLALPRALAIDRQGGYYVADTARGAIVHFEATGRYVGEWPTPQLGRPWAIVAAPDNLFLVLDADSGRVGRYDGQGHFLGLALAPEGPTATRGLGLGLDGRVYVAQTAASRVLRLDPRATEGTGGGEQAATADQPTAALADARGNIVIYEPDGARLRGVGSGGQARFARAAPQSDTLGAGSLAILPDGRIALVDARGGRIVLYGATGSALGSFPVAGSPRGIAVTPLGLLAVTDVQEQIIRLYTLTAP